MKKQLIFLSMLMLGVINLCAQPDTFNYQAVVRDTDGNLLTTETIQLRLSIQDDGSSNHYTELHETTTNEFGQIAIEVGGGTLISGDFSTIPWGDTRLWLTTEVSLDSGTSFSQLGQAPLLAVPYALYAASAEPGPEGNGIQNVIDNGDGTLTFEFTDGTSYTTPNLAGPTLDAQPGNLIYHDSTGWVGTDAIKIAGQNVGIGTNPAISRLLVHGDTAASADDPIFEVKNKDGNVVFAVYQNGVEVNVDESTKEKGLKGGFAVGGLTGGKDSVVQYFRVTPDSVRVYLREDTTRAQKGGFAVGGLTGGKGVAEYLRVTPDSTRVYVNNSAKGQKGGFAVGGLTGGKNTGIRDEYIRISPDSVRIYIDESSGKAQKGGFAVGGLTGGKQQLPQFFNVEFDTTQTINPSEPRILWYPGKNAFMAGQVLIEDVDSVGKNSLSNGFENKAIGNGSIAMGYRSISRGILSSSIGYNSVANDTLSFAFGNHSFANAPSSYAFGSYSRALGYGSFALGFYEEGLAAFIEKPTTASGPFSFAIGFGSTAADTAAVAMGVKAEALQPFSTAIGFVSQAQGRQSQAIGAFSKTTGDNATSIGNYAEAQAVNAFAFGNNAIAGNDFAMAVGNTVTSAGEFSYSFGNNITNSGKESFGLGNNIIITELAMNSFAIGNNIGVNSPGSFVFGDGTALSQNMAKPENSFTVRSSGGVYFYTSSNLESGVEITNGGSSWNNIFKNNRLKHGKAKGSEIYKKLQQLAVEEWSYKQQDGSIKHIGIDPALFYETFGLGAGKTKMTWIDPVGINTIAIQEQHKIITEQQITIENQAKKIKQLEQEIEQIKELIQK